MCEHFMARAREPFRLDELWDFGERHERFGLAGYGWGAGWVGADGQLHTYRDIRAFRDDPGREEVGAVETTSVIVHFRRPSRLSTLQLADTQPFADPAGRFVFSHNGDLRDYRALRGRYRLQGRIHGRADTEVGQRWLEDAWRDDVSAASLLSALHERFGGEANLEVLTRDGTPTHYAGNPQNPVFSFRLGRIGVVATGIYSLDRSLFKYAALGATERRLIRDGATVSLAADGRPVDETVSRSSARTTA
jgi:glutamine phosphoribosylpyrophosphate amidotransferase